MVRVKGLLAGFAVACYMKRGSACRYQLDMYISSGGTSTGTLMWHYLVLAPVLYSHSVLLTLLKSLTSVPKAAAGVTWMP